MSKWHILGNGDHAQYFHERDSDGRILLCNMPPFEVDPKQVYATCMVDFKMMAALTEGSISINQYMWVLGNRPRIWMYERSAFYLKYAANIKEFYLTVPPYCGRVGSAQAATNFNCGHMAVHYVCGKHKATEVHLYGFDTLFDFNMRSITDVYLSSDRSDSNNYRLLNIWRPVWEGIFKEFKDTQFILHHNHDALKISKLDNVSVKVYNDSLTSYQKKDDADPEEEVNLSLLTTEELFSMKVPKKSINKLKGTGLV